MKKQIMSFALAAAMLALSACGAQPNSSAKGGTVSLEGSSSVSGSAGRSEGFSVSKRPQNEEPGVNAGAASSAQVPEEADPDSSAVQDQPDAAGENAQAQPQTGVSQEKNPVSQPQPQPQPQPQTPAAEQPVSNEAPADPEPQEPVPAPAATKADAMAYIGQSVSGLIAALGQPNGSSYAPSCMGDGEDGELYYAGFTVYTYRENGTEIVQDVL